MHLLVVKLMLTKFVNAHLIKRIDKRLPLIKLMDMFERLPKWLYIYTRITLIIFLFCKNTNLKTYFVTFINLECD